MKRPLAITLAIVLGFCIAISTTGCSNACNGVKDDLENVKVQMDAAFETARNAYESASVYEPQGDSKRRLVPSVDANGDPVYVISDGPILDEFFSFKKIWLTIQVNNPECFDARTVADAQIELENY